MTQDFQKNMESLMISLARIEQHIAMVNDLQRDQEARIRNVENYLNQNLDNKLAISKNSESIKSLEYKLSKWTGAFAVLIPIVSGVVSWLSKFLI